MMSVSTRKSPIMKLTFEYFAIYSFYSLYVQKIWLFYSSVMEMIDFFSSLNTFPTRVHKNLSLLLSINPEKGYKLTLDDRGQVISEARYMQVKLIEV